MKDRRKDFRSSLFVIAIALVSLVALQFVYAFVLGMIVAVASGGNEEAVQMTQAEMQGSLLFMGPLFLLMIFLPVLLFKFFYGRSATELGLTKKNIVKPLIFGLLFGILSICMAVGPLLLSGQVVLMSITPENILTPGFASALVLFIFVGINEELFFRGFVMTVLKPTGSRAMIVLFSSLLFGVMHLGNPNITFFAVLNIALVGVLFALLFIRTGNLWAPIGYHITWNFFQGNVFGIEVSGTQAGVSIFSVQLGGAEWLTGGAFGIEGGFMCTVAILIGIVFTLFVLKKPENPDWSLTSGLPLERKKKSA